MNIPVTGKAGFSGSQQNMPRPVPGISRKKQLIGFRSTVGLGEIAKILIEEQQA